MHRCIHLCVCVCVCKYVNTCVYIHVCACLNVHVCIYTCMIIFTYVYIYHVHIYTQLDGQMHMMHKWIQKLRYIHHIFTQSMNTDREHHRAPALHAPRTPPLLPGAWVCERQRDKKRASDRYTRIFYQKDCEGNRNTYVYMSHAFYLSCWEHSSVLKLSGQESLSSRDKETQRHMLSYIACVWDRNAQTDAHIHAHVRLLPHALVCVSVCVCVWAREIERDKRDFHYKEW